MKWVLILFVGLVTLFFVSGYSPPTKSEVYLVLDKSYTPPSQSDVQLVLGDVGGLPPTSVLSIDWVSPTTNTTHNQTTFQNYTVQVCCSGADCGEVNVSLDPIITCYQESTNVSTACGGVVGDNYSINGNLNDGDWDTYSESPNADYYFNYTVPERAIVDESLIELKDGCADETPANNRTNISLKAANPIITDNKIMFRGLHSYTGEAGAFQWYVYARGGWAQMRSTGNCGSGVQSRA
jgi:hypothetical protein